ncbi:amidohydrolase [Segnochrobactrum spirostomi]|uniref:amidohydrolase n=1 Tax=Segnochrobactrum spirostomi TaxID=2608987 RepID=UPI0028AFA5C0|nr:amidohydrolase [Segnochrobactrum spirostomi]
MPSFVAEAVAEPDDETADIVFRNGPVYTVDRARPWARAVAVKGKRIVFVGEDAGVKPFIGSKTRIVDLEGKILLPGFVEGHTHPLVGAALTRGVDLQFDTREETLDVLSAYRSKTTTMDVVRGFGWRYCAFPASGPRKEDLDAIWPDKPVILLAIDGHAAWVNSLALVLAGVTKDTKDPIPGFSYFERDVATGEPTGYLVEPPVVLMVSSAIEPFSRDYVAAGLADWLPKAAAAGITAVFDAGIQVLPDQEGFALYSQLERAGELSLRVVGSHYHNQPDVDPVPVIHALQREFNSELVKASVLKLNIDGGDPQYTAALLAPYSDRLETSGDTLLPPEVFADIIRRADRDGIDIHVHSFGDRATRLSLDAIEAAIKANPPRDRRNALAHLSLVDSQDAPRFGELGVIAQYSAHWACPDLQNMGVTRSRFGAVRGDAMLTMKSVLDHGGVLSFGADWPAAGYYSTYRPLDGIEVATTRRELNKPQGPQLRPFDQAISLDAAIRANTLGPAYQIRMEHEIGSIEVGKFADLVVLERNLFEVAPQDIHKTRVLMTVMNGRVTHQAKV